MTGPTICGNFHFRDMFGHLKQGAEFDVLPLPLVTIQSSPMEKIEAILDKAVNSYDKLYVAGMLLRATKQNIAGLASTIIICWNSGENRHGFGGCTKPKDQAWIVKNKMAWKVSKSKTGNNAAMDKKDIKDRFDPRKCGPTVEFIW